MSLPRRAYYNEICGPTWMYRLYAGARLLYVGVAETPKYRLSAHRGKAWWPSVDRVTYTWFPTREEAFAAEKATIWDEIPVHNVARPKGAPLPLEVARNG